MPGEADVALFTGAFVGYAAAWITVLVSMKWERVRNRDVIEQLADLQGDADGQ